MKITKAFIADYLAYKAGRPLKIKELATELKIPQREYTGFRDMVKSMIDDGQLVRLRRGRIGIPSAMNLVVGNVSIARTGIGTIYLESGEPLIIPQKDTFTALDGDKVTVRVEVDDNDERYGKVIKVLQRAKLTYIGIFFKGSSGDYVTPDDRRIRRDILVARGKNKNAVAGERVVIRIMNWDDPYRNPDGEIIERLGQPGEPQTDLSTIIRKFDLPDKFPKKVHDQAAEAAKLFTETEQRRREDFSDRVIYTIDPADALDHDDAISVDKTANGYQLGVYIADVSFFVQPDTDLDKEAFERGNSVYLPNFVIPMLPESLSNNLCSLKPNCRRLTYAVLIDFNDSGRMMKWKIVEGVIKSRAKLSYEEVQNYFDSGKTTPRLAKVADSLQTARKLATILHEKRMGLGSIDFDLPEAKISFDNAGRITSVADRVRLESHRLIEEFMLAANTAVALHAVRLGQKFLFRVHDKPDQEKIEAFSYLVTSLGYRFPASPEIKPIQFAKFLKKIEGKPEEDFINELMLRSMQKAVYQPKNIGHFGLAFKHYTHFTSPIRRYPDLMVHRLLKAMKDGHYPDKLNKQLDRILIHVGEHCSETERTAEQAERDAEKMFLVSFMSDRIGDEFDGVISGILNFGFFVRLNGIGVEGMVRLSSLDDDYYNFDEKRFRLVGRQTGRTFRLGDPIRVGILEVDKLKSEINLFRADGSQGQKKTKEKKADPKKSKTRGRRRRNYKKP